MKYRTFVLIRNSVVGGVVLLAGFGMIKGCGSAITNAASRSSGSTTLSAPSDFQPATPPAERQTTSSSPPTARRATATDKEGLTEAHREALRLAKEPTTNGEASGAGRKWRVKSKQFIVELRSDTDKGFTQWNRLKIDLDRDKQWDEAWDLVPGKPVKRRVAPADDEAYAATYDLQGETWVLRTK